MSLELKNQLTFVRQIHTQGFDASLRLWVKCIVVLNPLEIQRRLHMNFTYGEIWCRSGIPRTLLSLFETTEVGTNHELLL